MATPDKAPDGKRLIFVRSFRHWKTGKIIVAPPGKAFPLYVKA